MFQFRRFPTYTYLIQCTLTRYCRAGLPHSEIHGSRDICSSPWLIAACHVLRRLLMPRHSPCALFSLTSSTWTAYRSRPRFARSLTHSVTSPFPRTNACAGLCSERGRGLRVLADLSEKSWFSRELCRLSEIVIYPNMFPHSSLLPLCCLTSLLRYVVQFSRCSPQSLLRSDWKIRNFRFRSSNPLTMVGPSGLEPPTLRLSVARSSQLSYGPVVDADFVSLATAQARSLTHFIASPLPQKSGASLDF